MASIDSLPGDQRAVLELVLRRGRSYDEIAQLLSIDRAGVRARALSALDALGPDAGVPAEQRALITDYLLGALPPRVAEQVRDRLAGSPSERAWARVVASELEPMASRPLPEIPAGPSSSGLVGEPTVQAPASSGEKPAEPEAGGAAPEERRDGPIQREPRRRRRGSRGPGSQLGPEKERPSSRRGGMVVLAGAAVIVVGVVLALTLTGGSSPKPSGSHTTSASTSTGTTTSPQGTTTPTTGTTGTSPQILAQINLNPPSGGSAKGIAEVLRQGTTDGIAIVAQGLKPNGKHDAYAVWLYNSQSDNHLLGFVSPPVKSNGKLQTAGGLPTNAAHFKKLLITLENNGSPKAPGAVVLEGAVSGLS
jgi:hypothetical protein